MRIPARHSESLRKVARCEVPLASSLNSSVPEELDQVLGALLAKDPATRYQSAGELGADLDYVAELLGEGDARAEAAALVQIALQTSPRASAPQSGTQSLSHSSLTRSPVTQSGTRAPQIGADILEELALLAEEDDPSRAVVLPGPPRR